MASCTVDGKPMVVGQKWSSKSAPELADELNITCPVSESMTFTPASSFAMKKAAVLGYDVQDVVPDPVILDPTEIA